jgi:hypothetical protein
LGGGRIERPIDPDTPQRERERRIDRLTEGPPVKIRADQARNRKGG